MNRKLYRSETDRMIGGVCGGLSQYLGVDSTFVRLFFVLLGLAGQGIGFMVYLLLWILVPLEGQRRDPTLRETVQAGSEEIADRARAMGADLRQMVAAPNPRAGMLIGAALVLLGLLFLVQNLRLPWLNWLNFDIVWPILLIVGGIALLVRFFRGD